MMKNLIMKKKNKHLPVEKLSSLFILSFVINSQGYHSPDFLEFS